MRRELKAALSLANYVKFSHDNANNFDSNKESRFASVQNSFYKNGLEIQPGIAPKLFANISSVLTKMFIPVGHVNAFVYSSPDIQAECYSSRESGCIIRFSSGLINLLNENELAFVIGHELGHYLYEHQGSLSINEANWSISSKAQEISADRLGLYACGSIEAAISTMMKITSGLNDNNLIFNVSDFLSQFAKVQKDKHYVANESTHPSVGVRSRSLLWFSMTDCFKDLPLETSIKTKQIVDEKIIKELHEDYDGQLGLLIKVAKDDYFFWLSALRVVNLGLFSKNNQQLIAKVFGDEKLQKLKRYLQSMTFDEAKMEVEKKVLEAITSLKTHLKGTSHTEIENIEKNVRELGLE